MYDVRGRMLSFQLSTPARAIGWAIFIAIGGYVVGRAVLTMDVYYLALAAICIASMLLFLRRIDLAIFVYALLAPFAMGGSPEMQSSRSSYDVSIMPSQAGLVVIVVLILARWLFWGREIRIPSLTKPLLVFLGIAILSVISTYIIWDSDIPLVERRLPNQAAEVLLYALCAIAFVASANAFDKREWVEKMIWPVTLSALYVVGTEVLFPDRIVNISRAHFLVSISLTLILARLLFTKFRFSAVIGWMILFVPLLWAAYHNLDWVSGWLTASLGMGFVLLARSRQVAIALVVIVLFVMFGYPGIYYNIYHESRAQGDLDRFAMWSDAMQMASKVNPILGIGPSSYMPYARKYSSLWYGENTYTTAHSNYADLLAETGIAGFLALIWIVIAGMRTGIDAIKRSSLELRWLSIAATSIFVSFAIASLVGDYLLPSRVNGGLTSFGTSVQIWVIMGAAIAGARLWGTKDKEQEEGWTLASP